MYANNRKKIEWLIKRYIKTDRIEAKPGQVLLNKLNEVKPSLTSSNKFTFDPPAVHNNGKTELSLCPNCNCVTKTINGNCGKCSYTKSTSVASVIENIENFGYDDGGFASQRAVLDLTIKINELIKQVNYLSSQIK